MITLDDISDEIARLEARRDALGGELEELKVAERRIEEVRRKRLDLHLEINLLRDLEKRREDAEEDR